MEAQCPGCYTSYHHSRLIPSNELTPQMNREYTILCPVCGYTFHVEFVPQKRHFFGLFKAGIKVVPRD
jgi:hypothetical protein